MQTAPELTHRRFTVDEIDRMRELGMLPQTGLELIGGELVEKSGRAAPRRWTYDEYVELGEAGIIASNERTELVNGEIIRMTPVGHRHIAIVDRLNAFFSASLAGRAIVRVQSPLKFSEVDAPYPDVVLLRPRADFYAERPAGPWDALLVVEVADTSIAADREKALMYARAAIPEYWIVDVNRAVVIVHRKPVGGEYTDVAEHGPGSSWTSPAMDGREVRSQQVLG
jgi:Uma2 family endonuclease